MDLSMIKTPTLLLDRDIATSNISRMVSKCYRAGVIFRPHFKTHQSRRVASWFRDAGVTGITVSSSIMASYFIEDGWTDVTIAFPYNPREHAFLEYLSGKARITLTVPGPVSASLLAEKSRSLFDVMLKVDTGYGRSGLQWNDTENAKKVAGILAGNSCLNFCGLLTHAGNTYQASNPDEVIAIYTESTLRMNYLRDQLGIGSLIISTGDTPSASLVEEMGMVDELRPGNFIFYDLMQLSAGICATKDIAVVMACPVVDTMPGREKMVIHGGAIHLSKDSVIINNKRVFGLAVRITPGGWTAFREPYYITSLSQEHGIISMPAATMSDFKPGDLVGIIPVHSCLTANLAGEYMLTDGSGADHLNSRKYHPSVNGSHA